MTTLTTLFAILCGAALVGSQNARVIFIARGRPLAVLIHSISVSYFWWINVKMVASGDVYQYVAFCIGATSVCVLHAAHEAHQNSKNE